MTWTYDAELLIQTPPDPRSPLMQVRRLLGDVLASDQQVQDEEILWSLSRWNIYGATAEMANSLAFQLARQVDVVQGELKTNFSNRSKQYAALARQMKLLANTSAMPYAGAVSVADKINVQSDPDRPPPDFNRGQFDDRLPVDPVGQQTQSFSLPDSAAPEGSVI
jgi:hypothetical protein